jgi:hypothetical protein
MDCNYLQDRAGDGSNAMLAAAGYNFSLLLSRFERPLRALFAALCRYLAAPALPKSVRPKILRLA